MEPRDGRAGLAQLHARLEALREYGRLVVEQEEAVAAEEFERAEEIAAARERLQERLGSTLPVPAHHEVAPEDREEAEELRREEARVLLEAARVHERMTGRLRELRDETRGRITGMESRETGVRSYLGRKGEGRSGLNIRF